MWSIGVLFVARFVSFGYSNGQRFWVEWASWWKLTRQKLVITNITEVAGWMVSVVWQFRTRVWKKLFGACEVEGFGNAATSYYM